ncbi:winged helix-turn-helix domain-containing protein [Pedobacter aquatilis]|uniref:winged helix-turn-helix domain-containing protein n=1 Tax=Pedobacter aquatilis TaxID=351343 RepID=UPI0025B2E526|nr:winged helix-turn-helix domain-containing protein [Pedobacter aquatilis]MDN3588519.1 winged helix-turn-helix domain-containing protein [Pedobacter aquatilis]
MLNFQNLLSGKGKYFIGLMILLFISAMCVAISASDVDDFAIARREVLLRRIGHELLLQSGDGKSRVLPIEKIADNEYQIKFENELTFQPGSLVNTTKRLLSKDPFATDYIVNVLNRNNASVTYGFAISGDKRDDIVSCIGRKQPSAPYIINIKFKTTGIAKNSYLFGSLPLLAIFGFIFLKSNKSGQTLPNEPQPHTFTLGSVLFDAKNRKLIVDERAIELTATETRVLLIFAAAPNETIERSRLQKEIWEDEGVIVGRSLDMFISKLRKKLEIDTQIKISVIRGIGYKLQINGE